MSILVNKNTRLIVQGITGRDGGFHTLKMKAYGTNVVAGVSPGKGGQEVPRRAIIDRISSDSKGNQDRTFFPHLFQYFEVLMI